MKIKGSLVNERKIYQDLPLNSNWLNLVVVTPTNAGCAEMKPALWDSCQRVRWILWWALRSVMRQWSKGTDNAREVKNTRCIFQQFSAIAWNYSNLTAFRNENESQWIDESLEVSFIVIIFISEGSSKGWKLCENENQ